MPNQHSKSYINRCKAIEDGVKYYESETPCPVCKSYEKYVSSNGCRPCSVRKGKKKLQDNEMMAKYRTKEKKQKWLTVNSDKRKQIQKRYDAKSSSKEAAARYYQDNKDSIRNRSLVNLYDITLEEYSLLLENQNHKCAICGVDKCPSGRSLAVDHDHKTNKIRGLLCQNCNTGLGLFKDNTNHIEKALLYLKEQE